ncbi:biotin carboxylase [Desulfosporosinus orientis DSM 765]|uniref:Biotin carboxylase n=1 Tax=Desulfosporosinus orientis (strain ATCC 19365 / DSM 765 / NCIMB 8382 / VKM B-1628 / Singapore I) TaxID=768706 RepID=G7WDN7_DESOD|nr:ATP-grasp domain-containing protein [Desulfosporosinus orientis]AET68362.1 biotin carboxylase [Desulfosporosinus orientis DSM 765]
MSDQFIKNQTDQEITNIYFNRCFTSTPKIIRYLLDNEDGRKFKVFISHVCENDYIQDIADYFEVEPSIEGKDYVNYCLDFCRQHKIKLFVPRYNVEYLSRYQNEFERLGVKVMFVGSSSTYQLLNDKVKTYQTLIDRESDREGIAIPQTFCVRTYFDFKNAYHKITGNKSSPCLKPISGIGGDGFKQILEDMTEVDELYKTTASTISKDRLLRVLKNSNAIKPLMVMEYLEGEEYSIDCLGYEGELIVAIPRRKLDLYRQVIEYREDLIAMARKLTQEFSLSYLYNIQIKYHQGRAYLIEINTRMSAGIHKSCLAGVNLLYLAVKLLSNETVTPPKNIRWGFQIRTNESYELLDLVDIGNQLKSREV